MKRRTFIRNTSLAATGALTSFTIPLKSQKGKLKVGLIGAGWYGMVITKSALKTGDVEVLAVCDVDATHLSNAVTELEQLQGSKPKEYRDYNDLLKVKGLQAVFIGTVPHWHALHFIAACNKGLDIYCEKPLAYDIREGQAMVQAAQATENIIQIGFQRRQGQAYKEATEIIGNNEIGKIRQIKAQIHYNPGTSDTRIQDPPESLDWETWCGPAPKLDYRPSIGHKVWRLEKEYGNGHLVDWGIHHIDAIRNIMGFGVPKSFETKGSLEVLKGKITTPDTLHAIMNFEECLVHWEHRLWGAGDLNRENNNGIFFYGEKGTLFVADSVLKVMPSGNESKLNVVNFDTSGMQDGHVANFVEAVRSKDKSLISCTVPDAFQSTASVQLAMISYYSNSRIVWDSEKNEILNNPKAESLLARPYREGYKRPPVG